MTGVFQLEDIGRNIQAWFSFLPRITLSNIFEIIIIAFLVYEYPRLDTLKGSVGDRIVCGDGGDFKIEYDFVAVGEDYHDRRDSAGDYFSTRTSKGVGTVRKSESAFWNFGF